MTSILATAQNDGTSRQLSDQHLSCRRTGFAQRLQSLACQTLVILAIIATACTVCSAGPNVLIVLADDLAARDLGCYGNRDVRTPHLDRLAQESMRFTNSHCATAMCSPCRQQLLTGLFPVRNGAFPNHSQVHAGTKSLVHDFQSAGYRVAICGKKHFGPTESFPFETLPTRNAASRDRHLRQLFLGADKKPFCLVYASNSPHAPWNETDGEEYDAGQLVLPPDLVDTPETRRALARYYGEVSAFDQEAGHLLQLLREANELDNTIVVVLSEQGCQFPGGKWTCYDLGLRCAMLVRWPGKVAPNSISDAMVQYVDILPTLLEACQLPIREGLDGRGFLGVLEGTRQEHGEFAFGVHTTRGIIDGNESYPIRSIRTKRFKLIKNLNSEATFHNILTTRDSEGYWQSWVAAAKTVGIAQQLVERYTTRPAVEFYDLANDPYELHNLAQTPEHQTVISELDKRLSAWMSQQGDNGLATEQTAFQRQAKHNRKK